MTEAVIWMLRHGATTGGEGFRGRTDDELTAAGFDSMAGAVATIGPVDRVVTSPLARCRRFAEYFAAGCGIALEIQPAFAEMDFGAWEGLTAAEVVRTDADRLEAFWRDPRAAMPPGGESFAAFEARVVSAVDALNAGSPERVLVLTHAGVIRVAAMHAQGRTVDTLFDLDVPHASVHRFDQQRAGGAVPDAASDTARPT